MTNVQVRGRFLKADGSAAAGAVSFAPRVAAVTDQGDDVLVVNRRVRVRLDQTGSFTVSLQASDDPVLNPTGWTYIVTEEVRGLAERSYDIAVPSASAGAGLDLVAVAPVLPSAGQADSYVLTAAFDALAARVDAIEDASQQLNPIVSGIARDTSGRIASVIEGGIAESVTRDASGQIVTFTAGSTTRTISRSSAGQIQGVA